MTIIGRSDLEPNTLAELVAYLEGRSGGEGAKTTFATPGRAPPRTCARCVQVARAGAGHRVPYRGTGPVMNDLIGKQIDQSCDQATNTTGPISSKLVKAYAVTTKARLASLPDVPTADEAGLKGFELGVWHGVFAPKGTPPAIVDKLSAALKGALKDPDLVKRSHEINTEPMSQDRATPEAAQRMLLSEIDRWAPIINASGSMRIKCDPSEIRSPIRATAPSSCNSARTCAWLSTQAPRPTRTIVGSLRRACRRPVLPGPEKRSPRPAVAAGRTLATPVVAVRASCARAEPLCPSGSPRHRAASR
jgi:hypothetical protein